MISPPSCQNKECKSYMKYKRDSLIKIINSKNKYICNECKKKFSWSMPKAPKGIIF